MYPEKKRREAVDLWFELFGTISVEDFVAELGYPSSATMARWIKADPRHDPDRPRYDSQPVLDKLQAIRRVAEGACKGEKGSERWHNFIEQRKVQKFQLQGPQEAQPPAPGASAWGVTKNIPYQLPGLSPFALYP